MFLSSLVTLLFLASLVFLCAATPLALAATTDTALPLDEQPNLHVGAGSDDDTPEELSQELPSTAEGARLALVELECDFPLCDDPEKYESLLSLTDMWPGRHFTEDLLVSAIHNLKKTGFFASIEPRIQVYDFGVAVLFKAVGVTFIREIVVTGNFPVLEREVTKGLFFRVGRTWDDDEEINRRQMDTVKRIFQQQGFFETEVNLEVEPVGPKLVRLKVVITKGERYRLGKIHVRGAQFVSAQRVARFFTPFLNIGHFTPGSVRQGRDELNVLYQDAGFFSARIRTDYKIACKENRLVDVFVDISEGTQYEIVFSGNNAIDEEELREQLTFGEARDADAAERKKSIERLQKLYVQEGYYFVQIDSFVTALGKGIQRVLFDIDEGVRTRVERIVFHGNLTFSDDDLKKVMVTREAGWIAPSGYLNLEELEEDLRSLQAFYRDEGFLHVKVFEPEIEQLSVGNRLLVHIRLDEGTRTLVSDVTFHGNVAGKTRELREASGLSKNIPYSPRRLNDSLGRIQAYYRQKGYPYTRLQAACTVPPGAEEVSCEAENLHSRTIALAIHVDERVPVVAGEFFVRGNFITSDRVIRREIKLLDGDPFDFHKLLQGQARLRRLGFFGSVNTTLIGFSEQERRDKVGIVVNVEEPKYRFLEFAAGAQTVTLKEVDDSSILTAAYWADSRFLDRNLFGWGKEFTTNLLLGTLDSRFASGYRDPQFLGSDLSFLFETHAALKNDLTELGQFTVDPRTFFVADRIQDNYNHFELSASATLIKEFRRGLMGRIQYKVEQVRHRTDAEESVFSAKPLLLTHLIPGATLDFRDSPLHPSKGFYLWGELDYSSSFLGSESNSEFVRILLDAQGYFPLKRLISASSFRVRWAIPFGDSVVGIDKRFFLGGDGSIRGFPSRSIGPKDDQRYLGDNVAFIFNQELRVPIQWGLWGALFYDSGTLISSASEFSFSSVRQSTGVGLRYLIAQQIPIRADVAWVIAPRPGEESWGWNAALGYAF